jgi:hypothetical protein
MCPGAIACCKCGAGACDCNTGPAPPGPAPGPPGPPPPPPPAPAPPGGWPFYMCDGVGGCGRFVTVPWKTDPAKLAQQVGSLSSLPGVPDAAYKPLAARWESTPPLFRGKSISLAQIGKFMQQVLLSDPFGLPGKKVPYVDFKAPSQSKVVGITQRQLAFIVTNSLMGNSLQGTADGLSAALKRCSVQDHHSILLSLLSLLAVLSDELSSGGGAEVISNGTMLIAATPAMPSDAWKVR